MTKKLTIEEIVNEADNWHYIFKYELNRRALGEPCNEQRLHKAFMHVKTYCNPQVYEYYHNIYKAEDDVR